MCGIVAIFGKQNPVSIDTLHRATAVLHHRGPDGQRHFISPSGRVGLGHARLSIIDLRTGDQPLRNENDNIHAVVNGEFYDFIRIRQELTEKGHRFRTESDSEILLHLYEELGASAVHQLRGEFAFALWDENAQILFAGRDRFGIKPLYYAWHKGTLYLASEVKALFAAGLPANWDHDTLFQSSSAITGTPNSTLFAGVYQVPPGHYLWVTRNRHQLVRYWDFDYPTAQNSRPFSRDAIDEFRAALDQAIRLRLHADVPVGCYLSGGLDSCSLLGMASRHVRTPIKAFTLSFDRADYDEEPIAREMAAHAGAEFYPIAVRHEDLADHFAEALWHSESLFFNTHGIAKFLLSRAVHKAGYKVVLTGEGADEILAGYPHFRRDLLLSEQAAAQNSEVAQLLANLQEKNKVSGGILLPHGQTQSLHAVRAILGFVPSWMESISSMAVHFAKLYTPWFANQFSGRDAYRNLLDGLDVRGQLWGREIVHQSMYTWSKSPLANYILNVLGDRMEMANSVEGRVPFLDHHVVELARSLPVSIKIHQTTEKYLLREAARPNLTDTVYKRQKHPFLAPPTTLNLQGRMYELLQDTVRGPRLAALPFFDQKSVIALLDEVSTMDAAARTAVDGVFMMILSACLLQERFSLGTGG